MKYMIDTSTKEEREQYIQELFHCHHGDCENCGVCVIFKGKSPKDVFKEYIEGKREFDEISREWNQRK